MSTIEKYVLVDENNHEGDHEYDSMQEAIDACDEHHAVIERTYSYDDSDLVVQQSSGDWDAKDTNMASYHFLVQQLSGYFEGYEFLHVPRNDND